MLTPDLVEAVVTRAVALYAEQHDTLDTRRRALDADLRRAETELTRLAEKIATGDPLPTLMDAMRVRERRRADLKAQLEHVDGLGKAAQPAMTAELRAALKARLEGWGALLGRNPIEARPILRQLLVGRLVATPRQLPEGRFYEFNNSTGTATYGKFLAGIVGGLVPPAGFEGLWEARVRGIARRQAA